MAMAMATSRRASLASPKNISAVVAFLCAAAVAASLLPLSSAGVLSLASRTCEKTAHQRLCIDTVVRDRRSAAAVTVQDLANIALTSARNSTLDAAWRTTELYPRAATPVEGDRLAQCRALYLECLRETKRTIGLVAAASYDEAARVSRTLHWYPEKCQSLLHLQSVESAMERTNKKVEEKLIASTDLVHLLLAPRRGVKPRVG